MKLEVADLNSRSTGVSRQLGAWIESLKNSEIKGTRYNDDRKRQETDAVRRRNAFLEELRRVIDEKKPSGPGEATAPP